MISAIEDSGHDEWQDLASGFQGWMDYTKTTAAKVSELFLTFLL